MIRRAFADTPAGQIHYREAGDGPPLVLLHETAQSSDSFGLVLPGLAETLHVYAPDTPGYGDSYRPSEPPGIAGYAQAILAFFDALGLESPILLGFHTGASLALEVAARWPDRVSRLLLCGCPVYAPGPMPDLHPDPITGQGDPYIAMWGRIEKIKQHWGPAERVHQAFINGLKAMPNAHWGHLAVHEQEVFALAPRVAAPTLLFAGHADIFVGQQDRFAAAFPNATSLLMPESRIFPMYDAPEAFVAVVERFSREPR